MVQLTRVPLDYVNLSERFLLTPTDLAENCFHRQFFHTYRARVRVLHERVAAAARKTLGAQVKPCRLTAAAKGVKVLVIGAVVKRVKQRPSVLRSMGKDEIIVPDAFIDDRLVGDEDYLEFEDEEQIVRITGALKMADVATGCVAGLYGTQLRDDIFHVDEVFWPSPAPQCPFPKLHTDKYVMFVSGLAFCGESAEDGDRLFGLELLQKWISGCLPLSKQDRSIVENLTRLVIAGESVAITDQGREFTTAARYLIRNEVCPNVESSQNMDKFLSKISGLVEVDVMPGIGDPTTHIIPQQPIHRAVFPGASRHGTMLNLVTNPYHFSLHGIHIMGTSGENLNDLKRFSEVTSAVDLLGRLLQWQHLSPTVPDTIDGFPFVERDPLAIEDALPHVLFAGNQPRTDFELRAFSDERRTLLLAVPSFAKTKSAAVVNLRNLDVTEVNFDFDEDMIE